LELVTCQDARDVQEGGFSRIVSFAMMHNNFGGRWWEPIHICECSHDVFLL
jgi:hypothetical protein